MRRSLAHWRSAVAVAVATASTTALVSIAAAGTRPATVDSDAVAAARVQLAAFVAANPIGDSGRSAGSPCRLVTPESLSSALGISALDPATWLASVANDSRLRTSEGSAVPVVTCAADGRGVELFALDGIELDFATVAERFDVANVVPSTPARLGGEAAGRCREDGPPTRCTVVWMRDGLVVGLRIEGVDFDNSVDLVGAGIEAISPVVVDTLVVGLPTTTTTTTTTTVAPTTVVPTTVVPTTVAPTTVAPTEPQTTTAPPTEPPPTTVASTLPPPTEPPPTTLAAIETPWQRLVAEPAASEFVALVQSLPIDESSPVPDVVALLEGADPAHPQVSVFAPSNAAVAASAEWPELAADPVRARQFVLGLVVDGAQPPERLLDGSVTEMTTLAGTQLPVNAASGSVGGAPVNHLGPSLAAGDVYLAEGIPAPTEPPVPSTPAPTEPPAPPTPAPTEPPPPPTPAPTEPPAPPTPAPTEPPAPPTPAPTEPPAPTTVAPAPTTDPAQATPWDVIATNPDSSEFFALVDSLPAATVTPGELLALGQPTPVADVRALLQGLDPAYPQITVFVPSNAALTALPDWEEIRTDPTRAYLFVHGFLVPGAYPPELLFAGPEPMELLTLAGVTLTVDSAAQTVGASPVTHHEPALLFGDVWWAAAVPVATPPDGVPPEPAPGSTAPAPATEPFAEPVPSAPVATTQPA